MLALNPIFKTLIILYPRFQEVAMYRRFHNSQLATPRVIDLALRKSLGAEKDLVRQLWPALARRLSQADVFALCQADRTWTADSVKSALSRITPRTIFDATTEVWPEGQPRPAGVRQLEENIL